MTRSRSARVSTERPFYDLHADAYDALITDPVAPWVDAIDGLLRECGVTSAQLLEAGCGTGRHAAALIERGHHVTLVDAAPALLAIAARRCPGSPAVLADLCAPGLIGTFDAVTCRGVLNDLVEDDERDRALASFASLLAPSGVLILDVRERDASIGRADGEWRTTHAELPDGGRLTFSSRPSWTGERILVEEHYELAPADGGAISSSTYSFWMRPWTHDELTAGLRTAGFHGVEIRPGVGRRTADRLLVRARRGGKVPAVGGAGL